MLRARSPVRLLTAEDRDAALALCATDPPANVFVASRIEEGGRGQGPTAVSGRFVDGDLDAMVWTAANVVPVATSAASRAALADRVRRVRRRCASLFGPQDQVMPLWEMVSSSFSRPRSVRDAQPLLATSTPPSVLGVPLDPRVRPGTAAETDLVVPAAAHMFTEEIGYPPYTTDVTLYRDSVRRLLERGRTYVVVEDGRVLFKADVGSCALGTTQVQGVWLAPHLRGRGLATPMMAAVVEQVLADHAPQVTLYVNDYNTRALATYRNVGMTQVGTFATVLL